MCVAMPMWLHQHQIHREVCVFVLMKWRCDESGCRKCGFRGCPWLPGYLISLPHVGKQGPVQKFALPKANRRTLIEKEKKGARPGQDKIHTVHCRKWAGSTAGFTWALSFVTCFFRFSFSPSRMDHDTEKNNSFRLHEVAAD